MKFKKNLSTAKSYATLYRDFTTDAKDNMSRLAALRQQLQQDPHHPLLQKQKPIPVVSLEQWIKHPQTISDAYRPLITIAQLDALKPHLLSPDSDAAKLILNTRMSTLYLEQARRSWLRHGGHSPLIEYVLPRVSTLNFTKETPDEADPSHRTRYIPDTVQGMKDEEGLTPSITFKYKESGTARISISSFCRNITCGLCYTGRTDRRKGNVTNERPATPSELKQFLIKSEKNGHTVQDLLFSGGDTSSISLTAMGKFLQAIGDAEKETGKPLVYDVRFGNRGVIANPNEFNQATFELLKRHQKHYPHRRFVLITHTGHSDDILAMDPETGAHILQSGRYTVIPEFHNFLIRVALFNAEAVCEQRMPFAIHHQRPFATRVNVDAEEMVRTVKLLTQCGITPTYWFINRPIRDAIEWAPTLEEVFQVTQTMRRSLPGIIPSGNVVASLEEGKFALRHLDSKCTILEQLRDPMPHGKSHFGGIVITHTLPGARWPGELVTDKKNILYDTTGAFLTKEEQATRTLPFSVKLQLEQSTTFRKGF